MLISDIMSTDVVTVDVDTPLLEVREGLEVHGIHHLLVISKTKRLAGIISDRELLHAISPFLDTLAEKQRDVETLKKPAHQIMTRKAISVNTRCTVNEAARIILEEGISCLVVVNGKGAIAGIVTWRDLMRVLSTEGAA